MGVLVVTAAEGRELSVVCGCGFWDVSGEGREEDGEWGCAGSAVG